MPAIEYIILNRWFEWLIANEDCHLDLIGLLHANSVRSTLNVIIVCYF